MENATKALLIAAAVLIAILIISLGIVIYQMAAETVEGVNFSGQEVEANNEKFSRYNGQHRRGSEVNAMLKTVLNANLEASAAGETAKLVKVTGGSGASNISLSTGAKKLTAEAETAKLYTITVKYEGTGGLASEITVTAE